MRKLRSSILSSSRTSVAVRPSLQCVLSRVTTCRNMAAGTTWTSSRMMKPHSREVRKSIIFCASCERFCRFATIE